MNGKRHFKNVLLAFVLISVGFSLGKHVTLASMAKEGAGQSVANAASARSDTVVVNYLYGNIRCVTCNTIEELTRSVLDKEFAEEQRQGILKWNSENFMKNEVLGDRYGLVSSAVVLSHWRNGKEVEFRRLDEVWTLVENESAFRQYVSDAIAEFIAQGEAGA